MGTKITVSGALVLATFFANPTPAQTVDYDAEIANLTSRPDVQRALRLAEALDTLTISNQMLLTEIAAPPFKEEIRAQRYAEMLREAGADSVWIDAEGNVIALRRGRSGGKTVALDAHLDTVFPEEIDVSVRQVGDTLFAPGVGDDTRGLAVVLTVLHAMNQADIETEADVLFIGTVGEEGLGDLRGVKALFGPNGPGIDSWIAVDGLALDRNTHSGLGSHRYRVTFKGPGGHSWGHFGRANPHHAMGRAITLFVDQADAFTRDGPRTSYNVGRIGGGTSVNSVPFESWMEVDMRSISPERLIQIDTLLQGAIRQALQEANEMKRRDDALTVDVDLVGQRPSGSIAVTTPVVQRSAAVTRFVGADPAFGTGSTDSNVPISLGIPAVTIGGGGGGGGAHSLDEFFVNDRGYLGVQKALLLLVAEAGLAGLVN